MEGSSSQCMHNSTKPYYGGWPLAIPTREKVTWNDFVEVKGKSLGSSAAEKDSGAGESFRTGKKRFSANKFSLDAPAEPVWNYRVLTPDPYTNSLKWDGDDDYETETMIWTMLRGLIIEC